VTLLADSFAAGLERGAMRGKGWRQDPFPGPLDLLMKLDRTYIETQALRLLSDELAAAAVRRETQINAPYLAISAPPQEGKSNLIARAFPLWLLMRDPDLRILVISYDDGSSVRWGRMLKNALKSHSGPNPHNDMRVNLSLKPGSEAVNQLELDGHGGGLSCMSIIGGITGKAADVILLDDVVKDRRTARSNAFKELWREQWQTAITSRLSARSLVVMDHTRWLSDDPIGQQLAEHGNRWRYVNIPAIVEERPASPGEAPVPVKDPLGRQPGEWLESARKRSPEEWLQKRADVGEPDFWALYQGAPFPATGALFNVNHFRFWQATGDPWVLKIPDRPGPDEDLRSAFRFITVDLAASKKTSADYTVAAAWAVAGTGELLLLDLRRVQVAPADHWDEAVGPLYVQWRCPIYVEGSQYSTDMVYTAAREGAIVEKLEADTDKYTRAIPAARRMKQGGFYFPPSAHWMPAFRSELKEFPTGAHDDQVDNVSYAHRVRGAVWTPPESTLPRPSLPPEVVRQAFGSGGADIGSTPL
jgi:predicted phage terminase large subunit-like protein